MIWKYTDSTNRVVFRTTDNGGMESMLVEAKEIQDWLSEGNTPEPADPIPTPEITQVTMRQARLALLQAGLLDAVEAHVVTPEQRIWWDYSTVVEKNNEVVNDVCTGLGITTEQVTQLFELAATL